MKLNQLTTNPATVKELLKDNPKAMQFLHRQCAFDFCKPFEVVQTFGAFTLNSVKKAINAETLNGLNIYILLKCFDRCGSLERELHAVEVNPHRVVGAQRSDMIGRCYDFNIDYFFGVGDFEDVRKKRTKYIYIIYQDAEHEREPKRNPDETYKADTAKRYNLIEACPVYYSNYGRRLQEITIKDKESNARPFKFKFAFVPAAPYTEAGEIIDKSGYIILTRREDLKRRAAALRAERAKADYLQRDLTEETEKTREELQKAAREAGEQLSAASLECDFERIKECCDKLRWAAWSLNRHDTKAAAKDFASVEAFFKSLDGIRKDIDTARKYLEPIQPADVHAIAARELPPDHIDHHESDLYIKFSAKSRALMLRLSCKSLLTTFKSQIDGETWYELPLCYNPAIGAGDR